MRLWPFKRKDPEPAEQHDDVDEPIEIIATPIAGLVYELLAAGTPPQAVVGAVQAVERERIRVQMSAPMSAPMSTRVSTSMSTKESTATRKKRPARRRAKWREQKRNQRAKLKLVTTG